MVGSASNDGLLNACLLDGRGGGTACGWQAIRADRSGGGILWAHFDRKHPTVRRWLVDEAGLERDIAEAMLTEDTRPRAVTKAAGMMINLRGANLNPGAEPDDMISVRMWIERGRILTLRSPRLQAVADLREAIEQGCGPDTEGRFLAMLADRLSLRLQPVIDNLADLIDAMEERVTGGAATGLPAELASIRRQCITLRRYLGPQREALQYLREAQVDWLDVADRDRLREVNDRTTRNIEDLDMLRERSVLILDEVRSRQADAMNRTMYTLSMVATIFLPLGLITGLLGINVGGMPGTDYPWAFLWVCVILVVLGVAGVALARWKRML